MKKLTSLILALALCSCVTDPVTGKKHLSDKGRAAVTAAESALVQAAIGAATYYLGGSYPSTNQMAMAGLSGAAQVVQAYVGQPIPQSIVAASAGNKLVGNAIAANIDPNKIVNQADVTALYNAAADAAVVKLK